MDIERRIAQVYQSCRTPDEIAAAFDALQAELDTEIQSRMAETRRTLLENFDEEVGERLRIHRDRTLESLSERERWLMNLTRAELKGQTEFDPERPRFRYFGPDAPHGWYDLDWKRAEQGGEIFYRQGHPLAARIIDRALERALPPAALAFDYSGSGAVISILKPLVGRAGWLELSKLTVESFDTEEFLVFAARTEDGDPLDDETCRRLLSLPAAADPACPPPPGLEELRAAEVGARLRMVEERNARLFDEEVVKLDRWSDDLKQGMEREIKELDKAIREARRAAALAAALADKLEAQKRIKALEAERGRMRRELFDAQDRIDEQRDGLIERIERQMKQRQTCQPVFTLRWRLH